MKLINTNKPKDLNDGQGKQCYTVYVDLSKPIKPITYIVKKYTLKRTTKSH
jgi:hypothetical protein